MKNLGLENYPFQSILVDDEDYDRVKQYKWWYNSSTENIYTPIRNNQAKIKQQNIELARFILNLTDPAIQADHKDRNRFNNLRENLRKCNNQQNCSNRAKQANNTSGFKGVYLDKRDNKWFAAIKNNSKNKSLGRFDSKEAAAKAYDRAAKRLFGEFACLNFPEKE